MDWDSSGSDVDAKSIYRDDLPINPILTLTFMAVRFGSEKNKVGNTSSGNEVPLTG